MQPFFLAPQSPLIFRSGRPFGAADGGGGADTYPFPMPGTIAGAIRSAYVDAVNFDFSRSSREARQKFMHGISIVGPFHATESLVGREIKYTIRLPKPADAMYVRREKGDFDVVRLAPGTIIDGADCDLPHRLVPVFAPVGEKSKPAAGPAFWSMDDLAAWLQGFEIGGALSSGSANALKVDVRTHISIASGSLTALDGGLFQSGGLDFSVAPSAAAPAAHGIWLWVGFNPEAKLDGSCGRVGADGRTVRYVAADKAAYPLESPAQLSPGFKSLYAGLGNVKDGDVMRMVLVTPAFFQRNGWYPDGMKPQGDNGPIRGSLRSLPGWEFELVAACLERWQPYAGAAMRATGAHEGQAEAERGHFPKPLKRLVPAGAVYWLKVLRKGSAPITDSMLKAVCYEEYARDGFGIALWGFSGNESDRGN